MKQIDLEFYKAAREWDRVHRIIGREPIEKLFAQSISALKKARMEFGLSKSLVDIGAGSGILGVAWLHLSPEHKCVFVEPKKKAFSFLSYFLGSVVPEAGVRSLVISSKLEDVSRETISMFSGGDFFSASRAFSGGSSLAEALVHSELSNDPCYVFVADIAHSEKAKYCLQRVRR